MLWDLARSNRQGNNPNRSARSSTRSLPACAPAWRALAHRFQPGADRLKRDVGICAFYCSNDGGQTVVRFATAGAVQDRLGQEAVADIGIHGAQTAALRPLALAGRGPLTMRTMSSQAKSGRRRRTWGTQS
jgi:hypothetical protein